MFVYGFLISSLQTTVLTPTNYKTCRSVILVQQHSALRFSFRTGTRDWTFKTPNELTCVCLVTVYSSLATAYTMFLRRTYKWTRWQCTYNVTLMRVRATIVAVEKTISVKYSESVFVALGIQHAMRLCRIVFCGLPGCTIYFHIIS